jgi:D-alanyl-D-alanine carboxypeptidase
LSGTVDSLVHAQMQQYGVPAITIGLAKKGTTLYAQAYGVIELSTQQQTRPGTVFEIGSITKQFTAALIMKLQELGQLHVDDSVVMYLPGYGFAPAITIRMLLTHTSGLADFTNFADFGQWVLNGVSEAIALTEIGHAGLGSPPGTQYSYSNSNYYLLGSIIEKLTVLSYAAVLERYIFQPLALESTFYNLPPVSIAATGYTHNGSILVSATIWNRSAAFAAGALSSNIYDLVTWDNALMSGNVVSPSSFRAMTTSNGFSQNGFSYGFGLALSSYNGRPIYVARRPDRRLLHRKRSFYG